MSWEMMSTNDIKSIAIIGSGKVANTLGSLFYQNDIEIFAISSRNNDTGIPLANKLNCHYKENYLELQADLIIVATSDQSVIEIINAFPEKQYIVHTAGSIDLAEINHPNCGVFYPLQTFTENRTLEINQIPILLEAKNIQLLGLLSELCEKLEFSFQFSNSEQRKLMHLSAVIVNNFVNHLVFIAEDEAKKNRLDWDLFKPILKETFSKIQSLGAKESQTGPARRKDLLVINSQQHLIKGTTLELYNLLTKSIIDTYKND
jgi:predicted short-subunit dehydrogenase-like oxidoreductase (DUF2520 family)